MELSVVEVLFNRGSKDALINLPPLAAALTFTNMLQQRIDLPVQSFKAMPHPYVLRSKFFFKDRVPFLDKKVFCIFMKKAIKFEKKDK